MKSLKKTTKQTKKNRNIKNQLLFAKKQTKQVNMLEDLKKETACGGSKNKNTSNVCERNKIYF